ncbi:MAG: 30S ribosomal protein S8 [bacterium]
MVAVDDPVADMLTRIRNALDRDKDRVDIPSSQVKEGVAEVLLEEGYILDFKNIRNPRQGTLRLYLKYDPQGDPVIDTMKKISKPGRRHYIGADEIEPVKSGLGISILSTPKGVLSGRQARDKNVGGAYLCEVW